MINRDVRNEMLRDKATDLALKGGHALTGWARESIAYGNGQKRARKVVSGYTSTCKFCQGVVRVSNGLAEPVAGEILEEPCMLAAPMVLVKRARPCQKVIRFSKVDESMYEDCA